MSIKVLVENLDSLFFNTHLKCNLCAREIFDGGNFCEKCKSLMTKNDKNICFNCGRQTTIDTKRCSSCNFVWHVDKARSAFIYSDKLRYAIWEFKFWNKRYLGKFFVRELYSVYVRNNFSADIITSVPVSSEQKFIRNIDHSKYLAKNLSEKLGVKYIPLLAKVKDAGEQITLNKLERMENLKNCFKYISREDIRGKKVLLVDDVLTTGATSHEIARVLKKRGAKSVYLLTVASAVLEIV